MSLSHIFIITQGNLWNETKFGWTVTESSGFLNPYWKSLTVSIHSLTSSPTTNQVQVLTDKLKKLEWRSSLKDIHTYIYNTLNSLT